MSTSQYSGDFIALYNYPYPDCCGYSYWIFNPLCGTVGTALFFGEHLKQYHLLALGIGFIGAILIIRPSFQEVSLGQLAQLRASPMFAASYLMAKRLSFKESSMVIVGMLSLAVSIAQIPIVLKIWDP